MRCRLPVHWYFGSRRPCEFKNLPRLEIDILPSSKPGDEALGREAFGFGIPSRISEVDSDDLSNDISGGAPLSSMPHDLEELAFELDRAYSHPLWFDDF